MANPPPEPSASAQKRIDPQMHTTEHILNRTMDNMFHCGRAFSAHLERKKSKCDYHFDRALTQDEINAVQKAVNDVIQRKLDVTESFLPREEAEKKVSLARLPEESRNAETIRIISVGDYDDCACSGPHVKNTREILGVFRLRTATLEDGFLRLRWCVK